MIKNVLYDHYNFIKNFENLIRKEYGIDENKNILSIKRLNFQSKGEINSYKYQFHGAGCRLEKEGIICEYNYNYNKIIFTLWDLKQFIITHNKYRNENLTDEDLELELYKLIENRELLWLIDEGVVWKVYQYPDGGLPGSLPRNRC